ncbi:MAG: hypothetical protein WCT01_02410 [Candidatus Shapirobacteria bacterium]
MKQELQVIDTAKIHRVAEGEGFAFGTCNLKVRNQCPNIDPETGVTKCGRCVPMRTDWNIFRDAAVARAGEMKKKRSLRVKLEDWLAGRKNEIKSYLGERTDNLFTGFVDYNSSRWSFSVRYGQVDVDLRDTVTKVERNRWQNLLG